MWCGLMLWWGGCCELMLVLCTDMSSGRPCMWAGVRRLWPSSAGSCSVVTVRVNPLGNPTHLPAPQDNREPTTCESSHKNLMKTTASLSASDVPSSFGFHWFINYFITKTFHVVSKDLINSINVFLCQYSIKHVLINTLFTLMLKNSLYSYNSWLKAEVSLVSWTRPQSAIGWSHW